MRRCFLVLLALAAHPAAAERSPAPGGAVRVHVSPQLRERTTEALLHAPLAEPARWSRGPVLDAAHTPIPGTTVRSTVLTRLERDGDAWLLGSSLPAAELVSVLDACFAPDGPWPGRALAAAGVTLEAQADASGVRVVTSHPVSPLPSLLTGCSLPRGPFQSSADGWSSRGDVLVAGVSLDPEPAAADLTLLGDGSELLSAPWPDVLLLVPDAAARDADPFELDGGDGLARFQTELAPDLLLAVRHQGRGAGTRGLLPPGVGPDRPAPGLSDRAPVDPTLAPLAPGAPGLTLTHAAGDPLAADLADRLALLLRGRGWSTAGGPSARIVRWRPSIDDPALAMLELAALLELPAPATLLDGALADRTEAALSLERSWLREGRVVPLLTAALWYSVSPRLRGVRVRGDGVPLLADAWWVTP